MNEAGAFALVKARSPEAVAERWNVEVSGGRIFVCHNLHEKGDDCEWVEYDPAEQVPADHTK